MTWLAYLFMDWPNLDSSQGRMWYCDVLYGLQWRAEYLSNVIYSITTMLIFMDINLMITNPFYP